jgi:hypothetical protein
LPFANSTGQKTSEKWTGSETHRAEKQDGRGRLASPHRKAGGFREAIKPLTGPPGIESISADGNNPLRRDCSHFLTASPSTRQ